MEKICIVKRRREYTQPEIKVTVTQPEISESITPENSVSGVVIEKNIDYTDNNIPEPTITPQEISNTIIPEPIDSDITVENTVEVNDKKIVEEFVDHSSSVISIIMTKEQSMLLQQSEYIKELLSGAKSDPALEIKLTTDGKLCFNYRFKDSLLIRMLAPGQVCQMLQVSRSFLQKMIQQNKIKSYKLGKMRRFLLEDILEYLSNDTEFNQYNAEK
jgi:excisionase family DNA binding protein